jgi:undecaprenyl diphosphate synthase
MEEFHQYNALNKVPQHVAIIMDGNGRWAKNLGKDRLYGHTHGVESVRETVKSCMDLGIKYLTLYAFSTENWSRPKDEVDGLMTLLVSAISEEMKSLNESGVRFRTIGDISKLPPSCVDSLQEAVKLTSKNNQLNLVLALNYSAQEEIIHATQKIVGEISKGTLKKEDITKGLFAHYLYTAEIPDPELIIRTSGEHRLSNFMLWQAAYAELHFTPVFWPEFRKEHLVAAIEDFQHRQRRFGRTSEQVVL